MGAIGGWTLAREAIKVEGSLEMNPDTSLIYLDNNATTAVDPVVLEEMLPFLTHAYGNPSSAYSFGKKAAEAIALARERVAALLGCSPGEIVFTSCGTESTNAAIYSALAMDPDRQHIITSRVEHSATLKTCERLATKGVEVTWLGVDSRGQIDLSELEAAIRPDTALVSLMWANNETGTLFPIDRIQQIAREKGVFFHTDAVQVIGKMPVRLEGAHIQFLSLSGHKLHCPKGVGAMYIHRKCRFMPWMTGGGQEDGRRAGTENVAFIVGLGKACELAAQHIEREGTEVRALRDRFERGVLERIGAVSVNGDPADRLPNTTNLAFAGVDSEAVLMGLDARGVCCSAGSACTTGSLNPSHVLKAMGFSDAHARSSLRFSFSHNNTPAQTEEALNILETVIGVLRGAVRP
jgi:cysteine desulfurase